AAERLDQLDVARLVGIGLDVVQARLAEEIERERLPGAPGVEGRAARLLRRAARDEAPGQAAHGLAQHHADDGVAEPAGHARDAERRVEEPGVRRVTPLEVLAQVADEIAVAVEGGEHVDETEELELGLLVSERPREERGGPAVGRIERLAVGGDAIKDLAADFLHARLAGPDAHDHLSLTPYPCHTHQTKSATMTSASAKCATTPVSTPSAAPTPVRTLGPGARPASSSPARAPAKISGAPGRKGRIAPTRPASIRMATTTSTIVTWAPAGRAAPAAAASRLRRGRWRPAPAMATRRSPCGPPAGRRRAARRGR